MKTHFLSLALLLLVVGLISCNEQQTSDSEENAGVIAQNGAVQSQAMFINYNYSNWDEKIKSARINFGDFTLSISGIDMWNDSSAPINTKGDITELYIAPGNNLEEQVISIAGNNLEDVVVEQSFETSMLVYGKDKMCELLNWKHFVSEWEILNKSQKGEYKCKSYKQQERSKFPEFSQDELLSEVQKNCSDICFQGVKEAGSIDENNSSVTISHYYIRITGKSKSSGEPIQKTIRIYNPSGC